MTKYSPQHVCHVTGGCSWQYRAHVCWHTGHDDPGGYQGGRMFAWG